MPSTSKTTSGFASRSVGWLLLASVLLAAGVYFAGRSGDDPSRYSNDFNVYYYAAREVLAGRDPYQNSLGAWTPYLYPPLLSELLIPIAVLPLKAAACLWFVVNSVSLILAARLAAFLLVRTNESDSKVECETLRRISFQRAIVAVGALIVVFRFALDSFALGQVNPVIASLVVAHVYLLDRERRLASAIALALAASIKLSPLLLIGYHLARRRLKFAGACSLLFLVTNALSFAVLGGRPATSAFEAFWNRTIRNEQGYDLAHAGNQSLRGVVARIKSKEAALEGSPPERRESKSRENATDGPASTDKSREPSSPATLAIAILSLAIAVLTSWRANEEMAAAAPFVCLMVLLSPLAWKAHFVGMLLAVAVLIKQAGTAQRSSTDSAVRISQPLVSRPSVLSAFLRIALLLVFSLWNLTSPNVLGLPGAEWADAHSLVFAGGFLLFVALCLYSGPRSAKFGNTQSL